MSDADEETEAAATPTLTSEMAGWLTLIDAELAQTGIAIHARPLHAARLFVEYAVEKIDLGNGAQDAATGADMLGEKWFRAIFQHAKAWYAKRYGPRAESPGDDLSACVLIFGVATSMKIPRTRRKLEVPGESVWLSMPGQVLADELPITWLIDAPDLTTGEATEAKRVRKLAYEVANATRAIYCRRLGVKHDDPIKVELLSGVLSGLERAAQLQVQGGGDNLKHAHWELQMSAERALKALAQERSGAFVETHDLFKLFDELPGTPLDLKRDQLKKLPNWQAMVELRYGGGPHRAPEETFVAYRAALKIVSAAMKGLRAIDFSQARVKLQMPPWMKPFDAP